MVKLSRTWRKMSVINATHQDGWPAVSQTHTCQPSGMSQTITGTYIPRVDGLGLPRSAEARVYGCLKYSDTRAEEPETAISNGN